jgi:hypothetical protein
MCVSVCVCGKMDSNFSRALNFAQVQLDVEDTEKMWICNLCNQNITTIWTYWLL